MVVKTVVGFVFVTSQQIHANASKRNAYDINLNTVFLY